MLKNQKQKTIKQYGASDIVGIIPFFTRQCSDFQAKSFDVVQYAFIKRDDFLRVLNKHAADCEIFHHIKDKLIFHAYSRSINQSCPSCGVYAHQKLSKCSYIFFDADQGTVIQRYNHSDNWHSREWFERSNNRFCNSLKNISIVVEAVIDYLTDHCKDEELESVVEIITKIQAQNMNERHSLIDQVKTQGESSTPYTQPEDIKSNMSSSPHHNPVQEAVRDTSSSIPRQNNNASPLHHISLTTPQQRYFFQRKTFKRNRTLLSQSNYMKMQDRFISSGIK